MKPIPKNLLTHSATYKHTPVSDAWGHTTYTETALKQVRIEPSSALKLSKDNRELQLKSVLFYDCRNSSPVGVEFAEGNKITFEGTDYNIASVDLLYDGARLHHVEAGLI